MNPICVSAQSFPQWGFVAIPCISTINCESNGFRTLLSAGYKFQQSAVRSLPVKSPNSVQNFVHSCICKTNCRESRNLLTEQALPLSEGSLSRQHFFGTSCILALAHCGCCINRILQVTPALFCHKQQAPFPMFHPCSTAVKSRLSLQPCFACK